MEASAEVILFLCHPEEPVRISTGVVADELEDQDLDFKETFTLLQQDVSAPFRSFVADETKQGRLPGVDVFLLLRHTPPLISPPLPYLHELAEIGYVTPMKVGTELLFVNHRLLDLLGR